MEVSLLTVGHLVHPAFTRWALHLAELLCRMESHLPMSAFQAVQHEQCAPGVDERMPFSQVICSPDLSSRPQRGLVCFPSGWVKNKWQEHFCQGCLSTLALQFCFFRFETVATINAIWSLWRGDYAECIYFLLVNPQNAHFLNSSHSV